MARVRTNFKTGLLTAELDSTGGGAASIEFEELPPLSAPDYLLIVLDPQARSGPQEIAYATHHGLGSDLVTLDRAQEGSEARVHPAGTRWAHAPVASDFLAASARGDTLVYTEDAGWIGRPSGYVHTQLVPTTIWMVEHLLNAYPNVRVEDSAGADVFGEITYVDRDRLTIQFTVAIAGVAYLS